MRAKILQGISTGGAHFWGTDGGHSNFCSYICNRFTDFITKVRNTHNKNMDTLDKTDLNILRTLQENGRLSTKELARAVNLSSTPVFERTKRLERAGYIKKYIAVLDAEKLNRGFMVFCNVKLRRINQDIALDFARRIQEIPQVTECYNISGNFDYMLKIYAADMKQYQEFLLNELGAIESVASIESTFVMSEVKHQFGIHL